MQAEISESERELLKQGYKLPLMEAFYTLQGEGFHTGSAAYFIRLGGCDVGCHWCDVKESWNPEIHPLTEIEKILAGALPHPAKTVVVTGGEPMSYDLGPLTKLIRSRGILTFLETSGAYRLSGTWDWICLSPKKTSPPVPEFYESAGELKVIIFNNDDLKWAELHASKVSSDCLLFMQPEWSRREKMMPVIVDYIMENPKWRMSLQTHKYLNIP